MKISNSTQSEKIGIDNYSKKEYINNQDVKAFINWLDLRLGIPGSFEHRSYLLRTKQGWQCGCLYEAFENYKWPYSFQCPLLGERVRGSEFRETFDYLNMLAESLRTAVYANDVELTRKSAFAMLTWGGVLYRNEKRVLDLGEDVCDYFKDTREKLHISDCRLGKHEGIMMNSGFTKLYFLLVDDFIMYDGRVGAALGLLGRLYAEEMGLETIPAEIKFSFGSGQTSPARQKSGDRRNPSTEKYKLSSFNSNPKRQLNDNLKASWLLKELVDKTESRFALLPQVPLLNERLTAIQSALFMIGYDVISNQK